MAIATENHSYGKTDEAHYAHYGIITDIKVQDIRNKDILSVFEFDSTAETK